MAPVGSDLTISELLEALRWKITTVNDKIRGPGRSSIVIAELDELRTKLSDVARFLTDLTIHRNSFCPVNSLPLEILADIFHESMLTGTASSFLPHEDDYPIPTPLLKASQVCHYWRQAALSFPDLWSSILVGGSSPALTELFLQRSKEAPLKIWVNRISFFKDKTNAVAKSRMTLSSQSHRFVECHMIIPAYDVSFLRVLVNPTSNLKAVSLKIEYPPADVSSIIFPDLFADHMPKLRKLALSCYPSWSKNCFKNLTHLFLHRFKVDTIHNLLNILADSPMLQELALIETFPYPEVLTTSDSEGPTVNLRYLHKLEVGGWVTYQSLMPSVFVSRLVFPLETELCFWEVCEPRYEYSMLASVFNTGSRLSHHLSNVTQLNVHYDTGYLYPSIPAVIHVKGTRMTTINFNTLHRLWPTPDLFPGRLETVSLLRGDVGDFMPGKAEMMAFFRSLPSFSLLSLSKADLEVVSQAIEATHSDDADSDDFSSIIPKAFFEGYPTASTVGATTWEEDAIADIQKYIPCVQLKSSAEIEEVFHSVWPTEASQWVDKP